MLLDELAGGSLSFKVSHLEMSEVSCEVLPPYGSALWGLFKRVFHPQWLPIPPIFFIFFSFHILVQIAKLQCSIILIGLVAAPSGTVS